MMSHMDTYDVTVINGWWTGGVWVTRLVQTPLVTSVFVDHEVLNEELLILLI